MEYSAKYLQLLQLKNLPERTVLGGLIEQWSNVGYIFTEALVSQDSGMERKRSDASEDLNLFYEALMNRIRMHSYRCSLPHSPLLLQESADKHVLSFDACDVRHD